MLTARQSYLLAVPVIAEVIPSCGARSPMYDVRKSLCCKETQRVAVGRLLELLLWWKGRKFELNVCGGAVEIWKER